MLTDTYGENIDYKHRLFHLKHQKTSYNFLGHSDLIGQPRLNKLPLECSINRVIRYQATESCVSETVKVQTQDIRMKHL